MNKYIAFDTETTGLDHTVHNLLTACFIILDHTFTEIDRLNLSIKHDHYNIDPAALHINKINIITHNINSIHIIEAKKRLLLFLQNNTLTATQAEGTHNNTRLIPLGHSIQFDINFIKQLLTHKEYNYYIHYKTIDTISIVQFLTIANKIPHNCCNTLIGLSNYFGITTNPTLQHTAEYDIEMTIKLFKHLLTLIVS